MAENQYEDILHLPHPVSPRRSRMTNYDRAAQFSPFAALTGYEAVLAESARLTDARTELDELEKERLNDTLREIQGLLPAQPRIAVTWFRYDERKTGGAYLHAVGPVKKLDAYYGSIHMENGQVIPIREITALELLEG